MVSCFSKIIFFCFFLVCGLGLAKSESSLILPKGWRWPFKKEVDQKWRNESVTRFASLKADFDGDEKLDKAAVLVSKDGKEFGIFVWWGSDHFAKPSEVYVEKDISLLKKMGVGLVNQGTVKTACGKGYFKCPPDDSGELKLMNNGINFFQNESANSVFHWDNKKKAFSRTWLSD